MTLNELKDGQKAIIINLNAQKELKNRLLSFGFIKNKNLKKIHSSLKSATIMVELDTSCVILRSDEAKTIEVNLI
ncbi:ferrous iron transport protein A [Campylobacter jejuni]|uniref:FeoA family protein n=1 Tax=Campylobacter jejuni TaxID=197 RepID=UPI001D222435|nr:ferrous iron transport protein A [Campylobacter jejuni]ECP9272316.1 ferrous iron transport protein A [Campylobacter jejuni]MCW1316496.1 ferrous iron transport protein A [Campylobacter jejuni]MCW1320812.1 ferrous iron transport protein A [Campylobacter jejuni]HEC2816409.1 ferrous iron transport protein A [Campylobacter jejuni]